LAEPTDARAERCRMSDGDAMRISRGVHRQDPAAITEFYEAWFDWCFAKARAFCRKDESFCLDVVQETMLRVIRSMPEFDSSAAQQQWLSRVICTSAIDLIRRDDRRATREHAPRDHPSLAAPQPSDLAAHAESLSWLRAQLDELESEQLALLKNRFALDHTLRSAAASSGCTEGSAHGRIRRLLTTLRLRGGDRAP